MRPVLHLDPAIEATGAVRAMAVLPSSPMRHAAANKSGPISPCDAPETHGYNDVSVRIDPLTQINIPALYQNANNGDRQTGTQIDPSDSFVVSTSDI